MTKNILALVDFSKISDRIVGRAGELSSLYGAKCWLIHVAAPDPEFVGYEVGPQYIRDHRADVLTEEHSKLQAYKEELEKDGVDCEALLVMGPVNSTIQGEIKKLNIDLVVLGSHGHSRLHDLVVGSVCEYMLRHTSVPMVVVPSKG